MIQINGGIVGFFFIYLFPALLQFKCLYFARPKPVFQVVFRASADASDPQNVELNEVTNIYDLEKFDCEDKANFI